MVFDLKSSLFAIRLTQKNGFPTFKIYSFAFVFGRCPTKIISLFFQHFYNTGFLYVCCAYPFIDNFDFLIGFRLSLPNALKSFFLGERFPLTKNLSRKSDGIIINQFGTILAQPNSVCYGSAFNR